MNWYDAVPPEADYSTNWMAEHNGYYGDFEWHTTPHWELAEFYYSRDFRWPVRSIATSVAVNQWVCFYSRMLDTGRTCDQVLKTSHAAGPNARLVAMKDDNTIGGDSGGPWSYYDKAFGIHKGDSWICAADGCKDRNVWSRVAYLPLTLGVEVLTQ